MNEFELYKTIINLGNHWWGLKLTLEHHHTTFSKSVLENIFMKNENFWKNRLENRNALPCIPCDPVTGLPLSGNYCY